MRAIISGAGRGVCHLNSEQGYTYAIKKDEFGKSMLDWQVASLNDVGISGVVFAGGYHVERIVQNYHDHKFY